MQREAGEAFDVDREPQHVRTLYGDNIQGRQMLIARRLVERGVRYVQTFHGAGQPWDSHNKLEDSHRRLAKESDQAVAALLDEAEDIVNAAAPDILAEFEKPKKRFGARKKRKKK